MLAHLPALIKHVLMPPFQLLAQIALIIGMAVVSPTPYLRFNVNLYPEMDKPAGLPQEPQPPLLPLAYLSFAPTTQMIAHVLLV